MSQTFVVTVGAGKDARERTVELEPLASTEPTAPPTGSPTGPRRLAVRVDGTEGPERIVEVTALAGGVLLLRDPESTRAFAVEVDATATGLNVTVGDQTLPAKVESARSKRLLALGQRAHTDRGPLSVSAPMPGRVVKVMVQAGATVKSGQGLLIVEAMKMENEVRSPRDGKVAEVRAREGQAVEAQETLLTLE
jgi:biotin carboxyl carrier protein